MKFVGLLVGLGLKANTPEANGGQHHGVVRPCDSQRKTFRRNTKALRRRRVATLDHADRLETVATCVPVRRQAKEALDRQLPGNLAERGAKGAIRRTGAVGLWH